MSFARFARGLVFLFWPVASGAMPLPEPPPVVRPAGRIADPLAAIPSSTAPLIRVRLREAVATARIRGFDLKIFQPLSGPERRLVAESDRWAEWDFRCGGAFVSAVRRGSASGPIALRGPVVVESPSGFFSLEGRQYRDRLWIHAQPGGCEVVNEVDIEKYLDGLVNAEFSAKWSEEAIVAQVVAARTYGLFQIRNVGPLRHFDVDATVKDQVYDGAVREDFRSSRGVNRSRGVVLIAPGSNPPAPIKAFYHSTCGGRTELPEEAWGQSYAGFKHRVACPYCAGSPRFKWELEFNASELSQGILQAAIRSPAIAKKWPANWADYLKSGQLIEARVARESHGGRARRIRLAYGLGVHRALLEVSTVRFREWLGASRVLSSWIQVEPIDPAQGRWRIAGRGHGHGVGLCQWGAKRMGERGFKAAAILTKYYPDAAFKKMW